MAGLITQTSHNALWLNVLRHLKVLSTYCAQGWMGGRSRKLATGCRASTLKTGFVRTTGHVPHTVCRLPRSSHQMNLRASVHGVGRRIREV